MSRLFKPLWKTRRANEVDIPRLEKLIPGSARELLSAFYSPAQIEAALGPVFGVDRQLIGDGTYYVVENGSSLIGCGGWSRRKSFYGGDAGRVEPEPLLDPRIEPARIRAFFVHPDFSRMGIGRSLMNACELAIKDGGFRRTEIVATLGGEALYLAFGYITVERMDLSLPGGQFLPVVRMAK